MLKRFIPKTVDKARKANDLMYRIRAINIHFSGFTLIALIFAIGGCVFTLDIEKQTLSRSALGLGGAALLLHGIALQIDQTTDDVVDELIEVIAKDE